MPDTTLYIIQNLPQTLKLQRVPLVSTGACQ